MQNKIYEKYIKKCISLARKGEGNVSPNPLVGAIVLDKNGNLAGYGWHKKCGQAHAEVNALKMAEEKGIEVKGGTVFVSLEPCSHYGKTPPCADKLIEKGIKKVVSGCTDPNPKVAGRGLKKLESAGVEVVCGVLEDDCKKLNEIFIKNQTQNAPFVAVKTAVTLDGKIATKTGNSRWITSEKSRNYVQKLRNKYDAILTGSGTVVADDPSLTCRLKKGVNPVRIIVDSNAVTPAGARVYNNDSTRVILVVKEDIPADKLKKYPQNVEILKCPIKNDSGKIDLVYLLNKLYEKGIMSILIEAGGVLNGAFFREGLVDRLYQFVAPKLLGDDSAKAFVQGFDVQKIDDCVRFELEEVKRFGQDVLLILTAAG